MENHNLTNETLNESELKSVYIYFYHPRDSKISTNKWFVSTDNGQMGGTHWTCFHMKDNKSFFCDRFRGQPVNFLLTQLPTPISFHNYKIQDVNSKLCGSYCLYFSYLMERIKFYNAILRLYFEKINADNCIW